MVLKLQTMTIGPWLQRFRKATTFCRGIHFESLGSFLRVSLGFLIPLGVQSVVFSQENTTSASVPEAADPISEESVPLPDPRLSEVTNLALQLLPSERPYRELLAQTVSRVYEERGFRTLWEKDVADRDIHLDLSKALADHAFPPLFSLDPQNLSSKIPEDRSPIPSSDLATTIALVDAGMLCRFGAVEGTDLWPDWNRDDTPGSDGDPSESLAKDIIRATAVRPFEPSKILEILGPKNWIYRELQKQFPAYREAILSYSGLPSIPDPASVGVGRPGEPYPYAPSIAAHLADRGYMETPEGGFTSLGQITPELGAALMSFQRDYGLDADGIFGPASWRFLNSNAAERYRSLSINLHRARLLPQNLGDRYAIVNLPCAELYLFEKGDFHVETMRVVHGKASKDTHRTPIFRDVMQEVVFGPYWNVPKSIAVKEVLPKAQADWGYLSRNRYEIVSDFNPYNKTAHRLSPQNLELVSQGRLFLRQKPGPTNALGHVKFLFPNTFNVYMHDTPARNFFARGKRDLSHGCIRVSKPDRLGEWVLQTDGWTKDEVQAAMDGDERKSVALKEKIPVYIIYLTTFPRPVPGGKIVLVPGRDVYELDAVDAKTLSAAIPWNQGKSDLPDSEASETPPSATAQSDGQ